MLRLFVGIPLPPEQRLQLSLICCGLPGVTWVDPGNYHVTLRFIGETDEGIAADIDTALMRVRSPRLSIAVAGLGTFGPNQKPRTLYAGIDRSDPLFLLHQRVEAGLMRAGVPPELRRYQPHVTLARLKGPTPSGLAQFITDHNLLRLPDFEVTSFALIRSYLTKSGSIYEDIATYRLR